MARGNLFQGMARGKVGDVVFYRMNGIQMSRVRNRTPKNPRSNEQLYQRAIIATTMKAYSAGKEIFDHAFQGYTVGEGCMRRFNSLNARILRSGMITDLYKNNEDCTFKFVAPKSLYPVACPGMQISEGTLVNKLIFNKKEEESELRYMHWAENTSGATTVNEFLDMLGTYAGDVYTIVAFRVNQNIIAYKPEWSSSNYDTQFACEFSYIRMIIKNNISNELTIENARIKDIFEIELGGEGARIDSNAKFVPGAKLLVFQGRVETGAAGAIRSRLDEDLRSTSYLQPIGGQRYGITAPEILRIWQFQVEKIGTSELILEGGEGASGVPALLEDIENQQPIIPAPVNEMPVSKTARHRGTRNEKNG